MARDFRFCWSNISEGFEELISRPIIIGGDRFPPVICFSNPEAIRVIFSASPDMLGYSQQSKLTKSLLGEDSFIFLPELEHQRQRKFIIPNWHKKNLGSCGKNIISITKRIIDNLIFGSSFDVRQVMKKISIEVISEELFGVDNHLTTEIR